MANERTITADILHNRLKKLPKKDNYGEMIEYHIKVDFYETEKCHNNPYKYPFDGGNFYWLTPVLAEDVNNPKYLLDPESTEGVHLSRTFYLKQPEDVGDILADSDFIWTFMELLVDDWPFMNRQSVPETYKFNQVVKSVNSPVCNLSDAYVYDATLECILKQFKATFHERVKQNNVSLNHYHTPSQQDYLKPQNNSTDDPDRLDKMLEILSKVAGKVSPLHDPDNYVKDLDKRKELHWELRCMFPQTKKGYYNYYGFCKTRKVKPPEQGKIVDMDKFVPEWVKDTVFGYGRVPDFEIEYYDDPNTDTMVFSKPEYENKMRLLNKLKKEQKHLENGVIVSDY